jgi:xanthine/uracil permease
VGINVMLSKKGTMERREYFTVGIPILMGATISIMPKQFFQLFPNIIASLVGNGLVMGILFSLLLEHVLFRQQKENR